VGALGWCGELVDRAGMKASIVPPTRPHLNPHRFNESHFLDAAPLVIFGCVDEILENDFLYGLMKFWKCPARAPAP